MITYRIKNKLYDEYLFKLREEITYDEYFHVDIEIKSQGTIYCLVSTLYAEGGKEIWADYDQPREYENPCISCHMWNLVALDSEMDVTYHDKDAEEIICQAINNYRL